MITVDEKGEEHPTRAKGLLLVLNTGNHHPPLSSHPLLYLFLLLSCCRLSRGAVEPFVSALFV